MKQESIFVEYFGDTPMVRVLNFLILGKDFDYSMTDIANGSHVDGLLLREHGKSWKKEKLL